MSNQNESRPASDAAPQPRGGNAPQTTTVYLAPHFTHKRNKPGEYLVFFNPGHTIDKHFTFLGLEFEVEAAFEEWYGADMDDQLLNAVRHDPGVAFVEDNFVGKEA